MGWCWPATARASASLLSAKIFSVASSASSVSASSTFDEVSIAALSASCVDSQFPADPASRVPRPVARDATRNSPCRLRTSIASDPNRVSPGFPPPGSHPRAIRAGGPAPPYGVISPRFARGPAPGGSRLGLLDVQRNFNRRVVGLKPRLAIHRRSPRFAWGPAPGGSRGYSSRAFFSTI